MILDKHAFPPEWISAKYNRKILEKLQEQNPRSLIVDGTWLDVEVLQKNYTNEYTADNIILVLMCDPPCFFGETMTNHVRKFFGIDEVRHFNSDSSDFCFWGYYAHHVFARFKGADFPFEAVHKFLSYNRKPWKHRVEFVRSLHRNHLTQHGIVTLGKRPHGSQGLYHHDMYATIKENDDIPNANVGGDCSIPNDITSLGDMDIWKKSFLNVVSETTPHSTFFSEKTFKPIIGKRPFTIIGGKDSLKKLHGYGFKTFNDYWDESKSPIEIVKYVCTLSISEIQDMYDDMQEILEYNHNHFFGDFHDQNQF